MVLAMSLPPGRTTLSTLMPMPRADAKPTATDLEMAS